jgi:D-lactate dehydrogenase
VIACSNSLDKGVLPREASTKSNGYDWRDNFSIASNKPGVVPCNLHFHRTIVIIYFVETESAEQEFFAEHLVAHDLRFVSQLDEVGADAEAICIFINSRITTDFLAAHPQLRFIATRSTALDHIDLPACRERKIAVANVADYGFTTVAEHTFALILALSRRLREVMISPKGGRFSYAATRGFDLAGKTIGIIGMGRIGQRVAELAHAFRMSVLAFDIDHPDGLERSLDFKYVPLEELLRESHIVSLHTPLTAGTYHILNRETLAKCQKGVMIVNTARGSLIDTSALREALDSGQVGGAGLDVLQDERVMRQPVSHIIAADIVQHLRSDAVAHEARDADRLRELEELMLGDALLSKSNVVFTPHVAFNSVEAVARVQQITVESITAFTKGQPVNLVD